MSSSLIPFLGRRKVKISKSLLEFVELDASLSEAHAFETQVSDHPVEVGANITDHVRVLPIKLKIKGVVSNHFPALTQINLAPTRAEEALGTLLIWQADAELLTVTTTLTTYENLLLKTVTVDRDKEKGNAVFMDLDFQEIQLAESQFAAVEPTTAVAAAKPVKTKGVQATKPRAVSLAKKGLGALFK